MVYPPHFIDEEVEARGRGGTRPGSRGSPLVVLVDVRGNVFSAWEMVWPRASRCLSPVQQAVGGVPGALHEGADGGAGDGAWGWLGLSLASYQIAEKCSSPSHCAGPADPPRPSKLCFLCSLSHVCICSWAPGAWGML